MDKIIEGNKLIDLFNDDVLNKCGWSDFEMNYHTDWNNLMPVVQKCIELDKGENHFYNSLFDSLLRIDEVWLACVEFIEWYNKNKNEQNE